MSGNGFSITVLKTRKEGTTNEESAPRGIQSPPLWPDGCQRRIQEQPAQSGYGCDLVWLESGNDLQLPSFMVVPISWNRSGYDVFRRTSQSETASPNVARCAASVFVSKSCSTSAGLNRCQFAMGRLSPARSSRARSDPMGVRLFSGEEQRRWLRSEWLARRRTKQFSRWVWQPGTYHHAELR